MVSWRRTLSTFAWSLGSLLSAFPVCATTLELNFVDTDDRPVEVVKAELLLVAWGNTERIELATSGNSLSLSLEPDWLRTRWRGFDEHMGVYLYLQAPPLAAIRSYCFLWPGAKAAWTERCGRGENSGATVIAFPGGREVLVKEGTMASMTLGFRPRTSRRVRMVDARSEPLPGVAVDVSMFWSDFNHTGFLAGAEPLGDHLTDANGWIEVPDGDFEYVLELDRSRHVFVEANYPALPWRLVTYLVKPTTEVIIHPFPVRRLEMRVRRGGQPAEGVHLYGHMAECHGAGCWGPLATTDESGHIWLDEFRPESLSSIWLADDDGELWRETPTSLPEGIVEIELLSSAAATEEGL